MKTKIKRFSCLVVVFAIVAIYSTAVFSAVPEIINYQGSLSDAGGNPVNATLNITFTLYDAEVAGSNLWQETQPVTVTNGQFSVQFGADGGNPLNSTLFENPIFLGVQVDTDAEMTPRQALTAVGYAFRSKTVENDTLNSMSCAADEIPKFNGSVWVCAADDSNTDTNAATLCVAGTFLNGDGSCDIITDTNTNAATLCGNGTFLNGDGSCDPVVIDTNTTYSAGSGLSLNGTTFSIPTGGIDASHLATGSVGGSEIAPDAVGPSELTDLAKGVGVSGVIVIPASAFQPRLESSGYNISTNGYITPDSLNGFLCLEAPVNLPHGVTVTHFEISVWDNSVQDIGTFSLRRVAFATGSSNTMGTVTSSGASPSARVFTDISISNAAVDGFANSYFITGCILADPSSTLNTRFYAARVRYN
jgi:hypothetical protein